MNHPIKFLILSVFLSFQASAKNNPTIEPGQCIDSQYSSCWATQRLDDRHIVISCQHNQLEDYVIVKTLYKAPTRFDQNRYLKMMKFIKTVEVPTASGFMVPADLFEECRPGGKEVAGRYIEPDTKGTKVKSLR